MNDSIDRFSRTVANYVQYRPTYPPAMVEFLQTACQLNPTTKVADIASGTGLVADVFLRHGYSVIGVEPNPDMRQAGQQQLQKYAAFQSIAATAEATTLEAQSVDLITVGQAFDWFDKPKARQEFARILRPQGWVVLLWNISRYHTPFMKAYQQLWQKYVDTQAMFPKDTLAFENGLRQFYAPGQMHMQTFDNNHVVDWAGLKGRVLSSSFAPTPEQAEYLPMLAELEDIFYTHQREGSVIMDYECRICYGQLDAAAEHQ